MNLTRIRQIAAIAAAAAFSLGIVWACGHDVTLREYLHASFWLPLARRAGDFERKNVRRVSAPFAGMKLDESATPLARLRKLYQEGFSFGSTERRLPGTGKNCSRRRAPTGPSHRGIAKRWN